MADSRFRAAVQPGDGVVARYGGVAVVIARGADAFTDALLQQLSAGYADPRALVWKVTGLVAAHQPGVPPFALAVSDARSRRVLVHGSARAVVDGEELDGAGLWTWREREVAPLATVSLTVAPGPIVPAPRSDLRDGVLSGAGLVLVPGEQAVPAAEPTPAPKPRASGVLPPRPPTQEE